MFIYFSDIVRVTPQVSFYLSCPYVAFLHTRGCERNIKRLGYEPGRSELLLDPTAPGCGARYAPRAASTSSSRAGAPSSIGAEEPPRWPVRSMHFG